MSVWRRLPRPIRYLGCAVLVASGLGFALANARADNLNVALDQARVIKLPGGVVTIIIGNPMIADGSLQPAGLLVVTGKGYGTTNLIALDKAGRVLLDKDVTVTGPRSGDLVVMFKGAERESYSCAPECVPRIGTLGDTAAYFSAGLTEAGSRNAPAATTK